MLKNLDTPIALPDDVGELWVNTTRVDGIQSFDLPGASAATQLYIGGSSMTPLVMGDVHDVARYLNGDTSTKPQWTYAAPAEEPTPVEPLDPTPSPIDPAPTPAPEPNGPQ